MKDEDEPSSSTSTEISRIINQIHITCTKSQVVTNSRTRIIITEFTEVTSTPNQFVNRSSTTTIHEFESQFLRPQNQTPELLQIETKTTVQLRKNQIEEIGGRKSQNQVFLEDPAKLFVFLRSFTGNLAIYLSVVSFFSYSKISEPKSVDLEDFARFFEKR